MVAKTPSGQTARDIAKAEGKGNTFDALLRRSP